MKSYLKFLSRNKLYAAIEAAGLAISLAFVIIIACFAIQQYGIAYEYEDRDRIYIAGMTDYPGLTYGFNDHLAQAVPEMEIASRYCPGGNEIVTCGSKTLTASTFATDPQFFEIFPKYRFISGSPSDLNSKNNVLISQSFATRLPYDSPEGKPLTIGGQQYTIAGIVEDFRNTLFPYADMIVHCESDLNAEANKIPYDHYGSTVPIIKLRKGADREEFTAKIDKLCKEIYQQFYGQMFFQKVVITRVDEIFFANMPNFNGGDKKKLMLLIGIGILLLLSAIFNYINLNFALSAIRAKEMATRRLVGASKKMIFGKYIAESLVFTAICTGAAVLLAIAITPKLNSLISENIPIRIAFSPGYIAMFLLLIIVVGIICGIIPAAAASRHEPIDIVRGTQRTENKRVFSKIFIILQGTLAVFMISMAIVTEAQYHKSLSRPMHASIENKYFICLVKQLDPEKHLILKDMLMQMPAVKRVGFAQSVPGMLSGGTFCSAVTGEELLVRTYIMDSTAFSMFAFEKLEDYNAPMQKSVWFSQKTFNALGFIPGNPDISELGRRIGIRQAGGVIADFPINSSNMGAEDYMAVVTCNLNQMYFSGVLVETEREDYETAKAIRNVYERWSEQNYGIILEPKEDAYISDIFLKGLGDSQRQMRLIEIFMAMAVLISLLGLLAMSTWYAARNSRDIAVRKVFGSTIAYETWSSVALYMKLVLISCIIGIPFAIYATSRYLQDYIYKIENYWWIFAIAVILSITTSFLSVLWQTLRAARSNPATELKKE